MKKLLLLKLLLLLTCQIQAQCWKQFAAGSHHALAIKEDGTLWTWGNVDLTQLGIDMIGYVAQPVKLNNDTDWAFIYAGESNSMAIKTDGTLWAWGVNYSGQLGNGTKTGLKLPTKIGNDTNWKYIQFRASHTAAIKNDGTLWAWGDNSYLQLGTSDNNIIPKQVGTDTDWKTVSAGEYNTIAIKKDGTLWAWGTNSYGSFGNGKNLDFGNPEYFVPLPEQIGTDTNWDSISTGAVYTAAIKTDGTLWTWGYNDLGQLGDGTTNPHYTPVQVGEDKWLSVSCCINPGLSFCGGIKADGSLWTWGNNTLGQLGNGSIVSVPVPAPISSDTDWVYYTNGETFSAGIKADNTLYTWGSNMYGQLGNTKYGDTPYTFPETVSCDFLYINEVDNDMFLLYPNPSSDYVYLSNTNNLFIDEITVSDITGKILWHQKNASQINVKDFPQGMYFVKIQSGNKNYQKIIIKK